MHNNKLVSVIMGIRNDGERFKNAAESIESQTYTNWEFIICDDGSTDDTYEKLVECVGNNPRYKIIRNSNNLGLAATLNRCIEHCNGEFIARMDADDLSYPTRIEKQVMFLENNPTISFVSSSIDIFDGEKIIGTRYAKAFPTKNDLIYGSRFVHPATMFRKDALEDVGGYRVAPETIRGQDYDLFMRMYGAGYVGANIEEALFRYTEDKANIKRRTFKARIGEMKVRIYGYKTMGVLHWAFPFVFKPYIAWLITLIKRR